MLGPVEAVDLVELEAALREMRAERRTSVIAIATDPAASTNAGGSNGDALASPNRAPPLAKSCLYRGYQSASGHESRA